MLAPLRGKHANRGTARQSPKTVCIRDLDEEESREPLACLPRSGASMAHRNHTFALSFNNPKARRGGWKPARAGEASRLPLRLGVGAFGAGCYLNREYRTMQ
jgi:hypothetical protein